MFHVLAGSIGGVVCGMISGLTPGIHANMIAALMLGFSPAILSFLGPEGLAAILIATLITHSFLEIVPATFLGVPDDGTSLSILPAHSLTMDGKGEEAVRISALGSLWGVILTIPLALSALWFIPLMQPSIDVLTGSILVLIMGMIIVRSEASGWLFALCIVSGILGLFSFRFEYLLWNTLGAGSILMPLLTGLFGLPFLLTASEGTIPRQHFSGTIISGSSVIKSAIPGTFAGLVVGWLPGLSTASANTLVSGFIPYDNKRRNYLAATGASTLANSIIGIAVFIAIGRMRNGVMAVFSGFETPPVFLLLFVAGFSALLAYGLTIFCAGKAELLSGLNSSSLNTFVAICLVIVCGVLTGPFGLVILILATAVGMIPEILDISRIPCMGVVTIPVILYSFGIMGL
ncbi:tripartite tricarboxylate transporter permease [Methanospirillum stamsii]|uniref:DUF112 domain-containing protein n=1 Tax=Methanospirillum stamsii TaxID=1277351 RepID=A0A2V2ND77_9EURY|nr:tripartite tricarboxylate transporter permease [Methanospirillum stamsii]PWR73551.1 hypothetical protein DLD82_09970 [Methanospirillum stamsii]